MTDPRKAATLGEAAQNPDGTYNGAKALSWLSEALRPGKGISEQEVAQMWDDAKAKHDRGEPPPGYRELPDGVRCRCIRMRAYAGKHFCCNPSRK